MFENAIGQYGIADDGERSGAYGSGGRNRPAGSRNRTGHYNARQEVAMPIAAQPPGWH